MVVAIVNCALILSASKLIIVRDLMPEKPSSGRDCGKKVSPKNDVVKLSYILYM